MAGAAIATLYPLHIYTPKPPHKSSPTLPSIPHPCSKITQHTNPALAICHAKLSGSVEDESEGIAESFFGNDEVMEEYESDDDDEEGDTESSIDLLLRFVHSMFKKVSKRAKKATRSILPDVISSQLVSFAVDGVLLLASLSIMKALLEVVCTLGGTVYVVILLLRVMWSAISYFQLNGTASDRSGNSYGRTRPAT